MKVTEYRAQYLYKGEWVNADFESFASADGARKRIDVYKHSGRTWEYRVAVRTVDYGEWEEVK